MSAVRKMDRKGVPLYLQMAQDLEHAIRRRRYAVGAQWYGVLVPAGTPAGIVAALNEALVKVIRLPEIQNRPVGDGSIPIASTSAYFGDYLVSEIRKWGVVVKVSGARVD